jgi:TetR/AcrR family transcriptional repressor of nem operon
MQSSQTSPPESAPTADQILDVAEALIQRRGYNAVSYADLAAELDLTTAAIHYHYPSKADLGQAVVARYRRTNAEKRAAIRARADTVRERLRQYVDLYVDVLAEGGLCLCGGLAADAATLPEAVRREVRGFFDDQETWLTGVLEEGTDRGVGLSGCKTPRQAAALFLAALEGAMITHRAQDRDHDAYRDSLRRLIDTVAASEAEPPPL